MDTFINCVGRVLYFFYSRTRLGYYYHLRNIAKAKKRLKRRGGWHTLITPFHYGDLMIVPIPIMMDNYAYLVLDRRSNSSVVVDPGHAEPVQAYLSTMGVKPEAVLITHKHWDHSGGNREMRQHYPEIKVYGSSSDNVPDITHPVKDGDTLGYGDLKIRAVLTPGHTTGHVVYILDGAPFGTSDSVFTGDMLFLCGCGQAFEGSATTMLQSLDYLSSLPDDTYVWPGHEDGLGSLQYACYIDDKNTVAKVKLEWAKSRRYRRLCTCPTTIREEKLYNPFLRTREESVLRYLGYVQEGTFVTPDKHTRAQVLRDLWEDSMTLEPQCL